MPMQDIYNRCLQLNMLPDDDQKEEKARSLFDDINQMHLPEYFNWSKEIFEGLHAGEKSDKLCLLWASLETGQESRYTYRECADHANKCLNYLRKHGLGQASNLYLMIPIVPETWILTLASIKGGIVTVPTATSMTVRELQYRFETYPPEAIVVEETLTEVVDEALKNTSVSPKIKIVLGHKEGFKSYDEIMDESKEAAAAKTRASDLLFCFFTSGTTGLPKRVAHSALSYPLGHLSTAVMIGITSEDIHHNLSAPGWAKWAWSSFFAPFNLGATATCFHFSALNASKYLEYICKYGVTTLCAPPTAWRMFVNQDLGSFDFSSLRYSVSAGEPLNPEVIQRWQRHTGIKIRDFYGQTESTAMIGNPPWFTDKMRYGSFGRPFPMYDVTLTDDQGREVNSPDETGHIVVRMDRWKPIGLFQEYMGNPEKTRSVFIGDYYYTGDRAYVDKDGFWFFVGRADDVIKSSDFRIGPFEVESTLVEHPAVAEAAVVGSPDPDRYQLVKACVTLNQAYEPSRELALELFRHCINILAKFKIPRIIEFVPELPKTISGKIRRIELRQQEERKKEEEKEHSPEEFFYWDFPELSSKK